MRRVAPLLPVLAACAIAGAASASGGGGSDDDALSSFIWQWVNLILLLGVLFYVARKPISEYFADRRAEVQDEIKSAAALQSDAEARFSDWQRKLAEIEIEIETIQEQSRERAESERTAILADANAAAERIQRDARAAVDQEVRRSRKELRAEAADLAVELAGNLLQQQVGDADRERLLDEFIRRIEDTSGNGKVTG